MQNNNTNKILPLSIKKYTLAFAVVSFALFFGLLAFNSNKVKSLNIEIDARNSALAEEELNHAILNSISSAKNILKKFSEWDETTQQLNNPAFYNYWRNNRALEASFIGDNLIALELFNINGEVISSKPHFSLLTNVNKSMLGTYIGKQNNTLAMYHIDTIKDSDNPNETLGYIAIKLDFKKLLIDLQRYKLIKISSLEVNISSETLISTHDITPQIKYRLLPNSEFNALETLMMNTIVQLSILTAILILSFLLSAYILLGKPLNILSLHIDALSSGKHEHLDSNAPGFFLISEFNKLRLSLNDYITQIEKLEQIANGDIKKSNIIESELEHEASGLMLSFNNIIRQLKETIEEKDHVSMLLLEKADELQKASEQASSANKAKSIFLANMSHEIRTPLTAIIGFAEASLDQEQSTPERLEALKIIANSGKHLLQIINDILDLSKVEAHKLDIEKLPISPVQIISEVESIIKPLATDKNLEFNVNYIFPLPETINSDPIRIKQILLNLCNNAIKFTHRGYVHLNVSYSILDQCIAFEVVDTGIGLTPSQIEKVFAPFSQAEASTNRKFGGTGLGLSLSNQLAEMLDGELTVKSKYDVGSTFTVSINIGQVDQKLLIHDQKNLPTIASTEKQKSNSAKLSGNILVADDVPENRKLISLYLNRMGIRSTTVDNGKAAWEYASNHTYDAIIMDIRMPIMDGLEATSILRGQGLQTPIIAITANAFKEDRDEGFDAGFTDYLFKPIDRNQLYHTLAKYLDKSLANDQANLPITSIHNEDEDFIEIIEDFISKLPTRINTIETAVNDENWSEAKFQFHSLKGTSGNVGFTELYEFAKNIEKSIDDKNYEKVRHSTGELKIIQNRIANGLS